MSYFRIRTDQCKHSVESLRNVSKRMVDYSNDIDGVIRALSFMDKNITRKLRASKSKIVNDSEKICVLTDDLSKIVDMYEQTEKLIMSSGNSALEIVSLSSAYDKTTKTFDDDKKNGTYGADQGDMAHNKKGIPFFSFRWFEDEELFAYIRKYEQYKNYSQAQIADLMDKINSEGCGYVAIVNNLYTEFEGKEEEFEKIFGFPMYDKNGRANYDYLIVDFYANTDNKYYIDESMGATALVNDVIMGYLDRGEVGKADFIKKYGCEPLIDGNKMNPVARQKILDEYQDKTVATLEVSGTTNYSLENRFKHYMEQKGIDCVTENAKSLDADSIKGYLEEGKNVNIAVGEFNLYNKNGKRIYKDVGDHWMTITDVTDDGRLVVSSWGKRYYLNQNELQNPSYYITDIFT